MPADAGPFTAILSAEPGTPGVRHSPTGWRSRGPAAWEGHKGHEATGLETEPPPPQLRAELMEQVTERGSTRLLTSFST